MLSWIREKFGTAVIGGIIASIALVFVFYGVFSPKSTRGLHEGSVAGTVNGDPISISEYNRELSRRVEFFKNMMGGKMSEEQLQAFGVREGVFRELANRKIQIQEAKRQGLIPSDEEVRVKITEMPVFQKDGKFDLATYKQILEANNYTPSSFERLMRDDIATQGWEDYFQDRIRVSENEVKREYNSTQNKRNIKYVLLTSESAKKSVPVSAEDVKKYLADPAKMNIVKMKFDDGAAGLYKGKKLDEVKETIARNILASEQLDAIQKINEKLADQIAEVMTADTSSDAKVNGLLKGTDIQVKTTGLVTHQSNSIASIGEVKDLLNDAFNEKAPIDTKQGGKAKKYPLAGRVLVAVVTETQKPDMAAYESKRESLLRQVAMRKHSSVRSEWMKNLTARAKIDVNSDVVRSKGEM